MVNLIGQRDAPRGRETCPNIADRRRDPTPINTWLANDLISSYLSAESSTDEDFRRRVEKLRVIDEEG